MGVLDAAKRHYEGQKDLSIEVPEWDCTLHYDRPTLVQRQRMHREKSEARAQARLLVECCRDADGKPAFDDADAIGALTTQVDARVVGRIVLAILGTEDPEQMGND